MKAPIVFEAYGHSSCNIIIQTMMMSSGLSGLGHYIFYLCKGCVTHLELERSGLFTRHGWSTAKIIHCIVGIVGSSVFGAHPTLKKSQDILSFDAKFLIFASLLLWIFTCQNSFVSHSEILIKAQ